MTDRSSRIFDDLGRFFTGAAGAMGEMRGEFDRFVCSRLDRVLSDMGVVRREEFEVVREMAIKSREEVSALRGMLEEGGLVKPVRKKASPRTKKSNGGKKDG